MKVYAYRGVLFRTSYDPNEDFQEFWDIVARRFAPDGTTRCLQQAPKDEEG